MTRNITLLGALAVGLALTGCAAIGADLKALNDSAMAADATGLRIERGLDDAVAAATAFLSAKGGEAKVNRTGKGIFGKEQVCFAETADARRELHIDNLRLNNGPQPDPAASRVRRVVLEKKEGAKWVPAPQAEADALGAEFAAFAKTHGR